MLGEDSEVHWKNFHMTGCQMLTPLIRNINVPSFQEGQTPRDFHILYRESYWSAGPSWKASLITPGCHSAPSLSSTDPVPLQLLAGTSPPSFRGVTPFPGMEIGQCVTLWHLKTSSLPEEF